MIEIPIATVTSTETIKLDIARGDLDRIIDNIGMINFDARRSVYLIVISNNLKFKYLKQNKFTKVFIF